MFGAKSAESNGMAEAEAEFPNPDKKKIMIPGQKINIKISKAAYKDAVVILKSCIFRSGSRAFVFVVNDDSTVTAVPVNYKTANEFAFITSGLKGGETVVSYASGNIEDGISVDVSIREFVFPEKYTVKIVPLAVAEAKKPEAAIKESALKTKSAAAAKAKSSSGEKKAPSKNTGSAGKNL
jgi:hypothetical protein